MQARQRVQARLRLHFGIIFHAPYLPFQAFRLGRAQFQPRDGPRHLRWTAILGLQRAGHIETQALPTAGIHLGVTREIQLLFDFLVYFRC